MGAWATAQTIVCFAAALNPFSEKMCFSNLLLEDRKRLTGWAWRLRGISHQDGWNTKDGQQYGGGEPLQSFFHGVNSFPR